MILFKKFFFIFLFFLTSWIQQIKAKTGIDTFLIGDQVPYYLLDEMERGIHDSVSIMPAQKKWLVLDFWSPGCTACVQSFPKIDSLQKEFGDKVQFLLVGKEDKYSKPLFQKYAGHYGLSLSIKYNDQFFKFFGVHYVPTIVIIDEKGMVRSVTYASELTRPKLKLLAEKNVASFDILNDLYPTIPIDLRKPFLYDNNGGTDSANLYRSVLTKMKPGMPFFLEDFSPNGYWKDYLPNGIQEFGLNATLLYRVAYTGVSLFLPRDKLHYGQFWPELMMEKNDGTMQAYQDSNKYCYSLMVPDSCAKDSFLMTQMQHDLEKYFGFHARVEKRLMPCWILTASENAKTKLRSKGGEMKYPEDMGAAGFTLANAPFHFVISEIIDFNPHTLPIIDQTGITGNVDISVDAVMTDIISVQHALEKNGLSLTKGTAYFNTIVIRK